MKIDIKIWAAILCFGALLLNVPAMAQSLTHGNGSLEVFDAQGYDNSPLWVRIWIFILIATLASSMFFIKNHSEARWVAAGAVAGFVAVFIVTGVLGVQPISAYLALVHLIFWTPALIILLKRRLFLKDTTLYARWTGWVSFVILFSFIFDIRDVGVFGFHLLGVT